MFDSRYKKYNLLVPAYLHNRPRSFIAHCTKRKEDGDSLPVSHIIDRDKTIGTFTVRSNRGQNNYVIDFGVDSRHPRCTCPDFVMTGLPCKHFFLVSNTEAEWNWERLPRAYREHEFFIPDIHSDKETTVAQPLSIKIHEIEEVTSQNDDITIDKGFNEISTDQLIYESNAEGASSTVPGSKSEVCCLA